MAGEQICDLPCPGVSPWPCPATGAGELDLALPSRQEGVLSGSISAIGRG